MVVAGSLLWQPKGREELAPVWACPQEKPVETVPLINPHCPEGYLYRDGERTGWKEPPELISKLPAGVLGTRRGRQLGSDMLRSTCHAKSLGFGVSPGHI